MERPKKIVVVGGGISGLATAFEIERLAADDGVAVEVTVLESSDRLGGKIHTERQDGFVFEWGTNGFLSNKPLTFELAERVGLSEKLQPANDAASKRFIFSEGRLNELPSSPPKFFASKLLSPAGRVRVALEPFSRKAPQDVDETIFEFACRRLGRQAAERLIDPMVAGVFAGKPEEMSLKASFPRMWELERDYGGLVKAMFKLARERRSRDDAGSRGGPAGPGGSLTTFEGGLKTLIDALAGHIAGQVRLSTRVSSITVRDGASEFASLELEESSESLVADVIVLATPAFESARMLRGVCSSASELLDQIPYPPATVVGLGFRDGEVDHPLDGFGFLIPSREKRQILGTLFTSSFFTGRAPEGHLLLRTIIGGARQPELCALTDEELINLVHEELSEILGLKNRASFSFVARHDRAIPQYTPGHLDRLQAIENDLSQVGRLFVVGNAYRGIGMNDCIVSARDTAQKVVSSLGGSVVNPILHRG